MPWLSTVAMSFHGSQQHRWGDGYARRHMCIYVPCISIYSLPLFLCQRFLPKKQKQGRGYRALAGAAFFLSALLPARRIMLTNDTIISPRVCLLLGLQSRPESRFPLSIRRFPPLVGCFQPQGAGLRFQGV